MNLAVVEKYRDFLFIFFGQTIEIYESVIILKIRKVTGGST